VPAPLDRLSVEAAHDHDEPGGTVAVGPSAQRDRGMEDVLDAVYHDGPFFLGHVQHAFDTQQPVAVSRAQIAEPTVKGEPIELPLGDKGEGANSGGVIVVMIADRGTGVAPILEPPFGIGLILLRVEWAKPRS